MRLEDAALMSLSLPICATVRNTGRHGPAESTDDQMEMGMGANKPMNLGMERSLVTGRLG